MPALSLCLHGQVLPRIDPAQNYEVTWYVSSSPCVPCMAQVACVLGQHSNVRFRILCSRLFNWEEPDIARGLKALMGLPGCKLTMMKPSDFVHVWETYVEKEEEESFAPWEDCQDNHDYYQEKLADLLK